MALGGQLVDKSGKPSLDDPNNVYPLELLKKITDAQGGYAKMKSFTDTFDYFGDNNQYVKNQVGAELNFQWYPNVLAPYMNKLSVSAVPLRDKNGNPVTTAGGQAFVIPAKAKNPAAACKWAIEMTTKANWMAAGCRPGADHPEERRGQHRPVHRRTGGRQGDQGAVRQAEWQRRVRQDDQHLLRHCRRRRQQWRVSGRTADPDRAQRRGDRRFCWGRRTRSPRCPMRSPRRCAPTTTPCAEGRSDDRHATERCDCGGDRRAAAGAAAAPPVQSRRRCPVTRSSARGSSASWSSPSAR